MAFILPLPSNRYSKYTYLFWNISCPGAVGWMETTKTTVIRSLSARAGLRARCSWSQVSVFQHYRNLPLASSRSQSLYSSPPPPPYPPFGSNPSPPPPTLCPRLPPLPFPLHPDPGLLDPSSGTPCQPHFPFRFPVHRLHWSRHSLSPPVPLPSVIRPPDQCRPRTPYPLRILPPPPPPPPCPQLNPYPPLPNT